MKNVHVLPTNKPSRLYKDLNNRINVTDIEMKSGNKQNIYITSDEEIKEGDWSYNIEQNIVAKCIHIEGLSNGYYNGKKIILTTDQRLIKDSVQAIDDEFLEWFVNNPSCEEFEVASERRNWKESNYIIIYKIIIPKEEKLTYSDALKKEERIFNSTMMSKKETLEEVAQKILRKNGVSDSEMILSDTFMKVLNSMVDMGKWMQERSYSEEEVYHILCEHTAYMFKEEKGITLTEWFEKFKKK